MQMELTNCFPLKITCHAHAVDIVTNDGNLCQVSPIKVVFLIFASAYSFQHFSLKILHMKIKNRRNINWFQLKFIFSVLLPNIRISSFLSINSVYRYMVNGVQIRLLSTKIHLAQYSA